MEILPFYSPELDRAQPVHERESSGELAELLHSPELAEEIKAGRVTVAMIRPRVGPEANLEDLPDLEAAEQVEQMIHDLGVVAKFSVVFDRNTVEEFYGGGPQASMEKQAPIDPGKYTSHWPEFINFMSSGPSTVLLLHSPDGDAIERWRSHLGHWNIDENRDPSTIRGTLGVNKYNNLVHGSDSPESALRELDIITASLTGESRE
jgi:nucleoside diphosphate kinase